MRESLYSRIRVVPTIPITSITANGATNGSAVDLDQTGQDFRVAALVVVTGTITDGTHTVVVQESADGSTGWTDVPASRLQGSAIAPTSSESDTVYELGVVPNPGTARFLRAVCTSASVTTGGTLSAFFLLGSPSAYPVVR